MARKIYQLKVTLQGASPPVWRRILVSSNVTLRQLRGVLQKAMGWRDCIDYRFRQDGREFGRYCETGEYFEDDTMFSLSYFLCVPGNAMEYVHDGFSHCIVLEAITEASGRLPWRVLDGQGVCPDGWFGSRAARSGPGQPSKARH